jgi:hypothetical protein
MLPILLLAAALSYASPQGQIQSNQPSSVASTTLTVLVPTDEAELRVGGTLTNGTGTTRTIEVPADPAGQPVVLTVSWRPHVYTMLYRTVSVRPPETGVVDLTIPRADDRADVIYVPTPWSVATRMVELAGVKPDDVVYELGSGDGRVLITAMTEGGAKRGVGIDIQEPLVERARANAVSAGVSDRVEFRHGDVFDDAVTKGLSDATVVLLYMSEELNVLLRPKLLKNLKPGARIVCHEFGMGDWKPDKSETFLDGDTEYTIHMWIVGAKGDR